jgi:hypothetical protein
MNQILAGALLPVAFTAVFAVWGAVLKRETTYKAGISAGKALSFLLGQKAKGGGSYEKNEDKIQTTIYDFSRGVIDGMDSDDDEKWKEK